MTKQKHFYLLRGLIREKGHWGHFLTELKHTFPDALITAIDIPGSGDYYTTTAPLSIKGMVEHMRRDYLKARTDNESSHLIAVSLGGMISVEWMKNYPQDFEQATLINTSFGGVSPVFQRLLPSALLFLLKVPMLKGREKESHILKLVSNNSDIFNETLDLWDEIQKKRPVSLKNTIFQLLAAAQFKIGDFRPNIPIQLIAAVKDRMVNIECSRTIAKRWALNLSEHPTGGHDLTADDPKWVASKIKEFTF